MTYSESAEGCWIGEERAMQEVINHGHVPGSIEYQEIYDRVIGMGKIDAHELLQWLGY